MRHRRDSPTCAAVVVVISDHDEPLDQVALEGEGGRGRARGQSELGVDVLQVPRDGVLADHELHGDLAIALSLRHKAEDLDLATGQPVPWLGLGWCEACEI